ncbi:unnamed protein product, partial [Mesorhabditis belari]|uniref:Uncharacterized protein n=1 Tax=Mesorhabditis belari TaxID=2138241 RepID=A0AAF3F5F3_9BILA
MSDAEAERISSDEGEESLVEENEEVEEEIEGTNPASNTRSASENDGDEPVATPQGSTRSIDEEEIDLDYSEEPPRIEENSNDEDEPENADQEVEDGEVSESDDGEIKSDDEPKVKKPAKQKPPRSDLEDGELEDGEISDSDDDSNFKAKHPRISGPTQSPSRGRDFYKKYPTSANRYPGAPGVSGASRGPLPAKPETAWDRGMREARELMKRASEKKKDPDFADKRMHLAPSDERDWAHDSDDESGQRIPSLLSMDLPPPRRVKNNRYKDYDLPADDDTTRIDLILQREDAQRRKEEKEGKERQLRSRSSRSNTWEEFEHPVANNELKCNGLGPQCVYPADGKGKKIVTVARYGQRLSSSNRRSRSPPPRPEAISSASSRSPSLSRSGSRSSSRPFESHRSSGNDFPRGKRSSINQRTRSRTRSGSSSHSARSPPTGDIASYRIPKRRQQNSGTRYARSSSEDRRSPWRDVGSRGNGDATRGRRFPLNRQSARDKTASPIDLAPTGAVAISDDESGQSSSSRSSTSSSSSSSRSSSSSSSSKSGASAKSKSPALPAKYRNANPELTETQKSEARAKRISPPSAKKSPPTSSINRRRGRNARSPSRTPPPSRDSPPPAPPPEKRMRRDSNRSFDKKKNRERGSSEQERPKTKEELLEELRRVEERLMRKRRQAAM